MSIVKSEMVLQLMKDDEGIFNTDNATIVFEHGDRYEADEDKSYHSETECLIAKDLWVELGKPDKITIAIQAGDQLSEIGDPHGPIVAKETLI